MEDFVRNFGFCFDINAFSFSEQSFDLLNKQEKKILYYVNYRGFFLQFFSYINIALIKKILFHLFQQKIPLCKEWYEEKFFLQDLDPFFYSDKNNNFFKDKIFYDTQSLNHEDCENSKEPPPSLQHREKNNLVLWTSKNLHNVNQVSFSKSSTIKEKHLHVNDQDHHSSDHTSSESKDFQTFYAENPTLSSVSSVSLSGKEWTMNQVDEKDVLFLQQTYGISDFMARLALYRMVDLTEHESIFQPFLKNHMEDPSFLPDAEKAYEHGYECLVEGKPLAVWGDYDVDGACASALLLKAFRHFGLNVTSYIPDRFQEGYGPNVQGLLSLKQKGYEHVFIVDCGTSALQVMEEAQQHGVIITIIDHHHVGSVYPKVRAFVNPKRWDYEGPKIFRDLCAGALVFMFLVGFMRFLREKNFFEERNMKEPDLFSWLDLVALSTICDMMPLRHLNRAFVKQGLKVMQNRQNIGLTSLIDSSGIRDIPNPVHIGYTIGPRINAGGRIGDSSLGVQLLSCEDRLQSFLLAGELNQLNKERQTIERSTLEHVMVAAEQEKHKPYIFVSDPHWHEGILGIISSNLKEYYNKPSFVMTKKGSSFKGSARSIPGVDVSKIIEAACEKDLLLSGGGHPMAGGLTIHEEKIPLFLEFLDHFFLHHGPKKPKTDLPIDMVITLEQLRHPEFFYAMDRLGPFGADYPQPRFLLPRMLLKHIKPFGYNHIRVTGQQANGLSQNLLCFRSLEKPLGQWLLNYKGQIVDCAISIQVDNRWGYQRTLLILDDIRL